MTATPLPARPRIMAVIPHYWSPGNSPYGSSEARPDNRIAALDACLQGLRGNLGASQGIFDFVGRQVVAANQALAADLEIVLLVQGDRHVLQWLQTPAEQYQVVTVEGNPRELGFAAQELFRRARDQFDWFFYLEDDLIIRDPWFLAKLYWFNQMAGPQALLQPQRFEITQGQALLPKVYIDGFIAEESLQAFRRFGGAAQIMADFLGVEISFELARNPHSGCYFLTREQLHYWQAQAHYGARDSSFVGPLESAASLGIFRTFHLYKSVPEQAAFLEIQHFGERYLNVMRNA